MLTGMLCGGMTLDNREWMVMLFDFTNEGQAWSQAAQDCALESIKNTQGQLTANEFNLSEHLPEKSDLFGKAEALAQWTQSFISGIGLSGIGSTLLTEDCREVLADLSEISQLTVDETEDLVEQADYLEVLIDHVQVCALTVYLDVKVQQLEQQQQKPTLH